MDSTVPTWSKILLQKQAIFPSSTADGTTHGRDRCAISPPHLYVIDPKGVWGGGAR